MFQMVSMASDSHSENDRPSKNTDQSSLVLTVPLIGAAGLELETHSDRNRAYGLAVDGHLGMGVSTRSRVTAAIHLNAGLFAKNYFSPNGFIHYGAGLGARTGIVGGGEFGLGAIVKLGNDWRTASGFVIGAEWLGASLVASVSETTALLRLPSLRIGFVF